MQRHITHDRTRPTKDQFDFAALGEDEAVLSACSLAFGIWSNCLTRVGLENLSAMNKSTLGAKIKFMWREPQMELWRYNGCTQSRDLMIHVR